MTTGERIQIREVLRQACAQSMLALAATNAAIEKRSRQRLPWRRNKSARVQQEIDRFIAEQETETLLEISGALALLQERPELFGVCEECGRSIPLARLRFSPCTSRCEQHAELPIE